jgi:glycine betaine/choline ABC-type transport system substrate-binding protein
LLASCTEDGSDSAGSAPVRLIERDPANGERPALIIGSKEFTEQFILAEIYAQALKAAGFRVTRRTVAGSEVPEKAPRDAGQAYEKVRSHLAKDGLAALPPTPFSNSNGFAMRQEDANSLGVTTLSGLRDKAEGSGNAPELRPGAQRGPLTSCCAHRLDAACRAAGQSPAWWVAGAAATRP